VAPATTASRATIGRRPGRRRRAGPVSGAGGDDVLDGGAGGDVVDGYSGRDSVRGGDGDDMLHGDKFEAASADVIDGGAGVDTIESDYSTRLTGDPEPLLSFTLGGGADDGRPARAMTWSTSSGS
jgi:Ca2+-binding RTX toxin-like protein